MELPKIAYEPLPTAGIAPASLRVHLGTFFCSIAPVKKGYGPGGPDPFLGSKPCAPCVSAGKEEGDLQVIFFLQMLRASEINVESRTAQPT